MKKCTTCQEELKSKNQKKFCSRSCAAKFNNVKHPKRPPALTRKCKNIECNQMIKVSSNRLFCCLCIKNKKHLRGIDISESTIEQITIRSGSNKYDRIRAHAHNLYQKEKQTSICQNCKYDKHVELCHIVPISSFSKDTKIKIVNSRENIFFLCPNCHWEHDHKN